MYAAKIARITGLRKHSNADKLQVGEAAGISCIVDLDTSEGDLGIVFPEDGAILRCFAEPNALYRKHPDTLDPMGGYLDPNGRVKALKLRGETSMGLWLPWESLAPLSTGPGVSEDLIIALEGTELTEWYGQVICEKYMTPATKRALAQGNALQKVQARKALALPKHYDTTQLRDLPFQQIDQGTTIVLTEKLHGTSGRTGLVKVEQELGFFKRAWNLITPKFLNFATEKVELVSGTRNCIVEEGKSGEKGLSYRLDVHDLFERAGLPVDQIWYYELVGFTNDGSPIMPSHKVGSIGDTKIEKQIRKDYGPDFHYSYGCTFDGVVKWRVFVYRIVDLGFEMSQDEIVLAVSNLNSKIGSNVFEVAPELFRWTVTDSNGLTKQELIQMADRWSRGSSILDSRHPREGVCVRFETPQDNFECPVHVSRAYKHKSFVFCALEGIRRNDDDYLDPEEIS